MVAALGQDFASECPSPNGYFSDAVQCDKYYDCTDGVITEKLCPDGMAFNDLNPRVEKCDFIFQVDCTGRPELQPAQPSKDCPRQNGYYPHADETNCDTFYYCASGIANKLTCPTSLVFSLKTGNCVWPEAAGRTNCASETVLNFTCPKVDLDTAVAHPRYADPHDCQFFYVCINGNIPRHNGCSFGKVFNSVTKNCDSPQEVPECADYYTEYFENYFNTLGDGKGQVSADIIAAAISSGFHVPNLNDRQRIRTPSTQRRGTTPRPIPALDDADSTSFGTPSSPRVRAPASIGGISTSASRPNRPRPSRPRPATSSTGAAAGGPRRRTRLTTTSTTTTTLPPPPPPPASTADNDYVYYDDVAYDYEYPVDAAPASATTEAPKGPSSFRSSLVRPRS